MTITYMKGYYPTRGDRMHNIKETFYDTIYLPFVEAIEKYCLISNGDQIAVCISGGKDSMLMAKLFMEYREESKIDFQVKYLVMDPGYNEVNRKQIEYNIELLKIPAVIFESDIFDAVKDVDKSPCYLCARMRRGCLYGKAKELGCNKIALGHHYDDVNETILMSMIYGAQIQTMMPKLHSTNFEGMELIRPLYLIREEDIINWRDYNNLQFIQCACRFTENNENSEENLSKRQEVKCLIKELKMNIPEVENNIFNSVDNVYLDGVFSKKREKKLLTANES